MVIHEFIGAPAFLFGPTIQTYTYRVAQSLVATGVTFYGGGGVHVQTFYGCVNVVHLTSVFKIRLFLYKSLFILRLKMFFGLFKCVVFSCDVIFGL